MLPPACASPAETLLTGPRARCDARVYHRVHVLDEDLCECQDCGLRGNEAWGRKELRAQEDFLMILGQEIIDLGNKELQQRAQFSKAMDRV